MERVSESKFSTICVFCGSSPGKDVEFMEAARNLGTLLAEKNINLVYGGGSLGLMGSVAKAVHDGGKHVLGVIPKALTVGGVTGNVIGEIKIVSDMHERKAEMASRADAFIALPGGFGTLEELFEVVTWAQLHIHQKPIGLLNVNGFYDFLLCFLDHAVAKGFISDMARRILISAPSPSELLEKLEAFVPQYDSVTSQLEWKPVESSKRHRID